MMRFATRVLLLQLATVVAVVAICTAVFVALGIQQLRAESESSALNIARTVAADSDVRAGVAALSAQPGDPQQSELEDGDLQALALSVADRTGALFVVITDDHGIRLAHPNPDLLGEEVSTSYAEALAGRESVTWERGTLGESARAKVPVYPPGDGAPVGEVSVGFESASVFDDLPALLLAIAIAALGALAVGLLAALFLRRRWERLTLGLQPEELVALVQNQEAVLDGVHDGVIALDQVGIVRVCNTAAARMLGLQDPLGRSLESLGVAPLVIQVIQEGTAGDGIVVGDRVLYVDARPVTKDGRALGDVVIVRDRTALIALSERLESVRAMSGALRVQRHEFANRMHVAAGLLDAERTDDARAFLAEQLQRGPVDFPVDGLARVSDPFLQSLLGAKAIEASERGVRLVVGEDTLLTGTLADVEDAAAIIGNLVDNAVTAAVDGEPPRVVTVTLLDAEDELVVTVGDSGGGIPAGTDVFARSRRGAQRGDARSDAPLDPIHGHGVGLALSRELARRRGGELWVIDPGGKNSGALFGARLPGAMRRHDSEEMNT